jgi:hypothetical protein
MLRLRSLVFAAAIAASGPPAAASTKADAPPARYEIRRGDALSTLCKQRYGSEHYAGLLALHNHVDPTSLQAGQVIDLPPLTVVMGSAGLLEKGGPVEGILDARERYLAIEPRLWPLVKASPAKPPPADQAALVEVVARLTGAADALDHRPAPPRSAIGQTRGAASLVSRISERGPDSYGYDIADVHRRIAYALQYLVSDARESAGAKAPAP